MTSADVFEFTAVKYRNFGGKEQQKRHREACINACASLE
jgi:hypothetical protein